MNPINLKKEKPTNTFGSFLIYLWHFLTASFWRCFQWFNEPRAFALKLYQNQVENVQNSFFMICKSRCTGCRRYLLFKQHFRVDFYGVTSDFKCFALNSRYSGLRWCLAVAILAFPSVKVFAKIITRAVYWRKTVDSRC